MFYLTIFSICIAENTFPNCHTINIHICWQLKRFSEEVTTDVVALSGMKFFHLTRGLVLSVSKLIWVCEYIYVKFYVLCAS